MRHKRVQLACLSFLLPLTLSLAGCGLTHSVKKGSASAARALFYPKVEILHLHLVAREALNTNDAQMPSPVVVRVWPLRNTAAFTQASYSILLKQDTAALGESLSGTPLTVRVLPGRTTTVEIPLADEVQAVAVAAFFLYPDMQQDSWRLTVTRNDMLADKPTIIELNNRALKIRGQQ